MNKHLLVFTALITFGFTKAQIKEKGTIEITPKIGTSNFMKIMKTMQQNITQV